MQYRCRSNSIGHALVAVLVQGLVEPLQHAVQAVALLRDDDLGHEEMHDLPALLERRIPLHAAMHELAHGAHRGDGQDRAGHLLALFLQVDAPQRKGGLLRLKLGILLQQALLR